MDNLPKPFLPGAVEVYEPEDAVQGDTPETHARKQLPYWNGMMRTCHMSLGQVTSLTGLGKVIDNSIKVLKVQRTLLGHTNGSRSVVTIGNPVPTLPD